MDRNILVVGPGGFLAAEVLSLLSDRGDCTILTLVSDSTRADDVTSFYEIDALKRAFPAMDTIYLLGAFIPYGDFNTPHPAFIQGNIVRVAQLSLAYPDSRIVFASSVSVYGQPAQLPLTVKSPFRDPDLYGLSKLAGEAIIRNHARYGIIRFSSLIGKGMKPITMLPRMIASAMAGEIVVYGDGARQQNYIDVRDAAAMCIAAADTTSNVIVLGAGQRSYSNLEVARLVQSLTGALLTFKGEDKSSSFVYDVESSYRQLGFAPAYTLEQSIRHYLEL